MVSGDVAELLAQAKAQEVSARFPGALVIGAEQALSLNGRTLHKPKDPDAVRETLFALRGKTRPTGIGRAVSADAPRQSPPVNTRIGR